MRELVSNSSGALKTTRIGDRRAKDRFYRAKAKAEADAKKAVAIALRNRWRRKQLRDDFKAEVRYSVLDKLCLQIMN